MSDIGRRMSGCVEWMEAGWEGRGGRGGRRIGRRADGQTGREAGRQGGREVGKQASVERRPLAAVFQLGIPEVSVETLDESSV